MSHDFFERHQPLLEKALAAAAERGYWSPFAESPSPRHYGETANDDGRAAFEALRGKTFPLELAGAEGTVGGEQSPFGFPLDISYPRVPPAALLRNAAQALEQ
ncbi:phenylacetic acid degradation protein PaaN, partial [Bordetella petrii]|nr:phenylacetic acid degradation protein PaaN [Bordetella petrii]